MGTVTRGRSLSAAAVLSGLAGLALTAYLYRYVLVNLFALATTGKLAWHVIRAKVGIKTRRRPKSSWSSLGRTVALMFGAWNTRWLNPKLPKASIPASASVRPEGWDR